MSEELAWSAGFFDGEGCTSATYGGSTKGRPERRYQYVIIDITQNHREPLDRFNEATGGLGKIYGPYTGRASYYLRVIGREKCQSVLDAIWPWLGSVKRDQAERRLSTCR